MDAGCRPALVSAPLGQDDELVIDLMRRWLGQSPDLEPPSVTTDPMEYLRTQAGVSDPGWSPPGAPEDRSPNRRTVWPDWVSSPRGHPIGSRWRLAGEARIVVAVGAASLVPREPDWPVDRYALDAGTELVLVEIHDESESGYDVAITYLLMHDFSSRTYRVASGPSSGIRLTFSADWWSPFPFQTWLAHEMIVPIEPAPTA
jgi:hypothetical protein